MDNKVKFLIVGRSGVGKSSIIKEVCKRTGMNYLKSYTTRPQREDDGDYPDHTFIAEAEADELKQNAIAWSQIGKHQYFATEQQLSESDFYIIDPIGVEHILEHYGDYYDFKIVYIRASNADAEQRTQDRTNYKFDERRKQENEEFSEFERTQQWDYHLLNNGTFEEGVEKMLSIINKAKEKK